MNQTLERRIEDLEKHMVSTSSWDTPAYRAAAREKFIAQMQRYIDFWTENPDAPISNTSNASLFARVFALGGDTARAVQVIKQVIRNELSAREARTQLLECTPKYQERS
jgi:hypothetical protein